MTEENSNDHETKPASVGSTEVRINVCVSLHDLVNGSITLFVWNGILLGDDDDDPEKITQLVPNALTLGLALMCLSCAMNRRGHDISSASIRATNSASHL